ncbi:Fic family protein [Micrococcales bacterium 31B]|nr:Fic family protein [Micrococcales bacterium 31B]
MNSWRPDAPYNDLPGLPPAHVDVESKAVLKSCARAVEALARVREAAKRLPNPHVLIHSLALNEARASSEIENIFTTHDELYGYARTPALAPPAARETLHYRSALFDGLAYMEQRALNANTLALVCSSIRGVETNTRALPGTRIVRGGTDQVVYSPPEGKAVIEGHIDRLLAFVHRELEREQGIHPLIVMSLAHYQFEAIHPFGDGNGRTGRILNVLILVASGLLDQPVLFMSREIQLTKGDYYEGLRAVTAHGEWERWVLYMLDVVRRSSESTLRAIGVLERLFEDVSERTQREGLARVGLMEAIFAEPVCRAVDIMERTGASRPTAIKWLERLVDLGVMEEVRDVKERVFLNRPLTNLLTELFAE